MDIYKTKPVLHFQVGYIHNPVNLFGVLRLITCFNVGNNFTTTNASNILSEFPCSLKVSHGFNRNKKNIYIFKKIMVLVAMVTATFGLLLQIIIYKEVLR